MKVEEYVFHRDDLIPDEEFDPGNAKESIEKYLEHAEKRMYKHGEKVRNIFYPNKLMIVDKEQRVKQGNYLIGFKCYWFND